MGSDKANEEKFCLHRILVKPTKSLDVRNDDNLANRLPVLQHEPKNYTPMPYVFRIPCNSIPTKVVNLMTRTPPFHVLLDHAISVIWLLFAKDNYDCPLGINQLQWALVFLKTIRTRNGDYPKDVKVCINAIEDLLVKQYADLQNEINTATELENSVSYEGDHNKSLLKTEEVPFSINYLEMIKCSQDTGPAFSMTSPECEENLEQLKNIAGVKSIDKLDSKSKEKAINMLKMLKTNQVENVRGELRKLRSIEDKMKDIDLGFEGYSKDDPEELLRM